MITTRVTYPLRFQTTHMQPWLFRMHANPCRGGGFTPVLNDDYVVDNEDPCEGILHSTRHTQSIRPFFEVGFSRSIRPMKERAPRNESTEDSNPPSTPHHPPSTPHLQGLVAVVSPPKLMLKLKKPLSQGRSPVSYRPTKCSLSTRLARLASPRRHALAPFNTNNGEMRELLADHRQAEAVFNGVEAAEQLGRIEQQLLDCLARCSI
jgi:hypothetical protein